MIEISSKLIFFFNLPHNIQIVQSNIDQHTPNRTSIRFTTQKKKWDLKCYSYFFSWIQATPQRQQGRRRRRRVWATRRRQLPATRRRQLPATVCRLRITLPAAAASRSSSRTLPPSSSQRCPPRSRAPPLKVRQQPSIKLNSTEKSNRNWRSRLLSWRRGQTTKTKDHSTGGDGGWQVYLRK